MAEKISKPMQNAFFSTLDRNENIFWRNEAESMKMRYYEEKIKMSYFKGVTIGMLSVIAVIFMALIAGVI